MAGPTPDATTRRAYLSQALKALRRQRGVSTADLAAALGIAKRTYQHFESGRTQINVERVYDIARILNADAHGLLMAVELGSPKFAVRSSDNKLMTIIVMELRDFDRDAADLIFQLDARYLSTAFARLFG